MAGRSRVLIVLMAGRSSESLSSASQALKTAQVKTIVVGMGTSFDRTQLSTMAFSSSYVQTAASFLGLARIRQSVSGLVAQGTLNTLTLKFVGKSLCNKTCR